VAEPELENRSLKTCFTTNCCLERRGGYNLLGFTDVFLARIKKHRIRTD
jgi:pyruvate-formate lyase-activating enzyme